MPINTDIKPERLTLGPGKLFAALLGATFPDDSEIALPMADTAVAAEWEFMGATNGGITKSVSPTYTKLEVDQTPYDVERRLTEAEYTVSTNLAETTLRNLQLALNGGTLTNGVGFQRFEPSNDTSATRPTYIALLLEGIAPEGHRKRVGVAKVLNVAEVAQVFAKADQSLIPVEFKGHYVSESTPIFYETDQVTVAGS
jgi:hypothetical protein